MQPGTKRKRSYSDLKRLEALAVLAAVGGNIERAARMCDVPARTLGEWAKSKGPGGKLSLSARLLTVERELGELKLWRVEVEDELISLQTGGEDIMPGFE